MFSVFWNRSTFQHEDKETTKFTTFDKNSWNLITCGFVRQNVSSTIEPNAIASIISYYFGNGKFQLSFYNKDIQHYKNHGQAIVLLHHVPLRNSDEKDDKQSLSSIPPNISIKLLTTDCKHDYYKNNGYKFACGIIAIPKEFSDDDKAKQSFDRKFQEIDGSKVVSFHTVRWHSWYTDNNTTLLMSQKILVSYVVFGYTNRSYLSEKNIAGPDQWWKGLKDAYDDDDDDDDWDNDTTNEFEPSTVVNSSSYESKEYNESFCFKSGQSVDIIFTTDETSGDSFVNFVKNKHFFINNKERLDQFKIDPIKFDYYYALQSRKCACPNCKGFVFEIDLI